MSTTPNIDRVLATKDHDGGLFFGTVDVVSAVKVTPRMMRITFEGGGLARFHLPGPNVAVRLFFPLGDEPIAAIAAQDTPPPLVRELRTRSRVYTASDFDPTTGRLSIDFVLHGSGLASQWANEAVPGRRIILSGPRSHAMPPSEASHVLFTADESALGALESILRSLPQVTEGHVFVSVADRGEIRELPTPPKVSITWVTRTDEQALVDAVTGWLATEAGSSPKRGSAPAAWLAGELFETREVRDYLKTTAGYDKAAVKSFPYWRRGSTGTSLDEARSATATQAIEQGKDPESVDDFRLVQ